MKFYGIVGHLFYSMPHVLLLQHLINIMVKVKLLIICYNFRLLHYWYYYPRRARRALGVDIVLTLDVCLYVCMLPL